MSILTDFYNLELDLTGITEANWHTPEPDREKILDFFGKHAPEVLRYQTAAEVEALPKPILGVEIIGTLGYFEYRRGKSWFDSDTLNFRVDYKRLRELVDLYLEGKEIPKHVLAWISALTKDVRIRVRWESQDGKVYGSANIPGPIDSKRFSLKKQITTIAETSSDSLKVQLNLGRMRYQLYCEIQALWNGEIEVRKCGAVDCNRIFTPVPQGQEQRYCSSQCRKRAWAQNHSKKFGH